MKNFLERLVRIFVSIGILLLTVTGCSGRNHSLTQYRDLYSDIDLSNYPSESAIYRFTEYLLGGFSAMDVSGNIHEFIYTADFPVEGLADNGFQLNDYICVKYHNVITDDNQTLQYLISVYKLYPQIEGTVLHDNRDLETRIVDPALFLTTDQGDILKFPGLFFSPKVTAGDRIIATFVEISPLDGDPYFQLETVVNLSQQVLD